MKHDTALAAAIASSLAYVIVVGVSTSARAPTPDFVDPPVAMLVRFAESDRILRINDATQVSTIAMWLDAAFDNPRSKFDLRLLPPPSNELEVRFDSGEAVSIFFSGGSSPNRRTEALRQIHETETLYVVQFDGVSYTKGCYTGQETVARLHFRGHTNRRLAGLLWEDTPDTTDPEIVLAAKSVGRVTSVAWLHGRERYVGLGMIRNTADWGDVVKAAGAAARVVELPLGFDEE